MAMKRNVPGSCLSMDDLSIEIPKYANAVSHSTDVDFLSGVVNRYTDEVVVLTLNTDD